MLNANMGFFYFLLYNDYICCRRCYINFIRKVNDKKGLEGQEETRKAFDFMLGYVGLCSFLVLDYSIVYFCYKIDIVYDLNMLVYSFMSRI